VMEWGLHVLEVAITGPPFLRLSTVYLKTLDRHSSKRLFCATITLCCMRRMTVEVVRKVVVKRNGIKTELLMPFLYVMTFYPISSILVTYRSNDNSASAPHCSWAVLSSLYTCSGIDKNV